jgi:hypothetical protein
MHDLYRYKRFHLANESKIGHILDSKVEKYFDMHVPRLNAAS